MVKSNFITFMVKKILPTLLIVLIAPHGIGVGIVYCVRHSGGIASNGIECAEIGGYANAKYHYIYMSISMSISKSIKQKKNIFRKILQQMKGNAADAAIATIFCEGVVVPQACGLGGGFFLTIYTKSTGKVETLNARDVAPKAATEDMFVGAEKVNGIRYT